MTKEGFEEFCGGQFWNLNLTWNTAQPDFTDCFQITVVVWLPCAFLWLVLPFYTLYLRGVKQGKPGRPAAVPIPVNRLNTARTVLAVILCIVSVIDIIYGANEYRTGEVPLAYVISPLIQAVTYLFVILTIQNERRSGFITSGVLFLFWLLSVVCGIIPFYTKILRANNSGTFDDMFRGVTFYVSYIIVVASFVMTFIADKSPTAANTQSTREPCPEVSASFPSRLIYWWLNAILITGYRKTLTEQDLWDLNPRDKTGTTFPVFEAAWKDEMEKCRKANAKNAHLYDNDPERKPLLTEDAEDYGGTKGDDGEEPKKKSQKKTVSLMKTLGRVYLGTLLSSYVCKFISDVLTFAGPLLQNQLIGFIEDKQMEEWKGWLFAVLFLVSAVANSIFVQKCSHIGMALGMRIKAAVIAAIYKKALRMSNEARKTSTVGEVVTLMSVDAQRLQDITGYLWMMWSAPLQIGIAMYLLYNILGPSTFAGLAVMLLFIPVNAFIAAIQRKIQINMMKTKDSRIKVMNEVLNGIKVLKLYAWELSFKEKVNLIRENELELLKKGAYLGAVGGFTWTCAPFLVTLATFAVYVSTGGVLDAQKAFVSLSLFNILRLPISLLPLILTYAVMASVSVKRVGEFLQTPDLDDNAVTRHRDPVNALTIENGTFSWGTTKDDNITLQDVNVRIPRGSLVAVVGQVGCGKSSLISSLLGEMEKLAGKVNVNGSVAYVAQQAWIQNATLKDNILFSKDLDEEKYDAILEACALKPDLEILPGGDQTEIGEKGINLSGGQKQRVSLARAVYNDADIYYLDDPLSAVDSHVGKHIFQKVISSQTGALKAKTRLLVTHGIHWLPHVDSIIVLVNGRVTEQGSYEELLAHDGDFAQFLKTYVTENQADSDAENEDEEIVAAKKAVLERLASITPSEELSQAAARLSGDQMSLSGSETSRSRKSRKLQSQKSMTKSQTEGTPRKRTMSRVDEADAVKQQVKKKGETLIQEETSEAGGVKWDVFGSYLKGLGYHLAALWAILFLTFQVASVGSNLWLSVWTEDSILLNASYVNTSIYQERSDMYLGVYGGLGAVQALFTLMTSMTSAYSMVRASRVFHTAMLHNVLRSPMEFFDTTPMGRILNRFSRDIETVDSILPQLITTWMQMMFAVLSVVAIVSYSTPIFLVMIVPLGILYYFIQRFYIPTARQLKRIESTSRSPIYVHFSETVTGASTIRAYGVENQFMDTSAKKVDHNLIFYFSGIASARWLGVRLESLGALTVFAAAVFAVLSRNTISGSIVGLSISYALQITQTLNWMVRVMSDLESNIVSVERVKEYSETPQEALWTIPETRPPRGWPDEGKVALEQYCTRYREGLDLVLKGITADIAGGEKIGIVGRTGAGKSSLTLALFRLIEASAGSIVIDGVHVEVLGLHQLRSKLTILPQDPVLFSGSLRMNLDPFDQFTDTEVHNALRHAHLDEFVGSLTQGLDYECGEGGQNLSVGQRQLVCLARALLRKTKILILDEATAAVDLETDELIQNTIRTEFADCTVLTIAHRLNTIMDSTRVMVLDAGKLVEFDTPQNLLANKESIFYGMAKEANLHHQQSAKDE